MKSKTIRYYSTNQKAPKVSFSEALLKGLAPDGGLFLPDSFPAFNHRELELFAGKSYSETAFLVLDKFIGNEIDKDILLNQCKDSYNFDVPIEKVTGRKYILRLDNGPTASFKDFAARMMSRLMQHFLALHGQHLTILTATSGDTGSAVASAFYGMENINVIILFPGNEVTLMQRKQMSTLRKNITTVEIDGKFDDCQSMVKKAFQDESLNHLPLSSANSINIGRLLPQSVYYFYAWSRLAARPDEKAVFSVPSGNFGNIMGGLISQRMGLPVKHFIAATNENNEVPDFLRTGVYTPISPSKNCISSAMNVGHPSNLARIVALYGGVMDETGNITGAPDIMAMRKDLSGIFVSDDETRGVIVDVFRKFNILLEPHGAVAWHALNSYQGQGVKPASDKQLYISLETAHPAKFPQEIKNILDFEPKLPRSMNGLREKEEYYLSISNSYPELKEIIVKNSIPK